MKTNKLIFVSILALVLTFSLCGIFATTVFADETATESAYDSLWIFDYHGSAGVADGTTFDAQAMSMTVGPGQSFGYSNTLQNQQVSLKLTWSTCGNTTFSMRATGDNIWEAAGTGYMVRLYPNGLFDFVVGGTEVVASANDGARIPTFPDSGFAANNEYVITMKTVDLSDGNVKFSFSIYDTTSQTTYPVVDYVDSTQKLTGSWLTVKAEPGAAFTVKGDSYQDPIILSDIATPVTSSNFPATINSDGSVTTTSAASASGVAYTFQTTEFFSYKFKFTPTTLPGIANLKMTIGGVNGLHEMNRDEVFDATWGWVDTGYRFYWQSNGQFHYFRTSANGTFAVESTWGLPAYTLGQTYEIEYGVSQLTNSNRIFFKIDGVVKFVYFDVKSESNQPLQLAQSGQPGSLLRSCLITTTGMEATLSPCDSQLSTTTKTLATKDLGTPATNSGATLDRNGEITAMPEGRVVGYNSLDKNNVYKFKANFTTIGSSIILQMRASGTVLDTPEGGSWTNKGYVVHVFSNGQAVLQKGGAIICEGWSIGAPSLEAGTDYVIEAGAVDVGNGAVRVFVKVNGAYAINYLDTNNAITNGDWFTIFNNAYQGTLSAIGLSYPTTSSDVQADGAVLTNSFATLSYDVTDKADSDVVTYHINADKTTALGAEIKNGNQLFATGAGDVYVYSCVNGIYSKDDAKITFKQPAVPQVVGAPATIVFGSANVTIDGAFPDDTVVTSKTFGLTNGSGQATINEQTGEITPVKAGTISVYTTLNGIKSADVTITILPVITIDSLDSSIIKGQNATLTYKSNCDLPDETLTANWQVIEGDQNATIVASTGVVTGVQLGKFKVQLLLTGETFSVTSQPAEFSVAFPQLVDLPDLILAGGETQYVDAKMSDDSAITTKVFGATEVSGKIEIDAETGAITPVRAGTVKVFATVNGIKTEEYTLTVTPVVYVNHAGSFAFGGTYELQYDATRHCSLPDEDIVVEFELVDDNSLATLDSTKKVLTVGNNVGTIGIKVKVTGETFQAVSAVTNFNIERPIVLTHPENLPNLYVGQSFTVNPFISQGGFDTATQQREIVVVEGGDCVQIDGLTIKAIKAGTFKFKVKIDSFESLQEAEIAIEAITATIIAKTNTLVGDSQTVSVMLNVDEKDYQIKTVVWSIESGSDVVTLDNSTGLLTAIAPGKATIKVVVDDVHVATVEIVVNEKVVVLGFADNQRVLAGSTVTLSYRVNDADLKVESIKYQIVSGADCVSIDDKGVVTALKAGKVVVKIIINGSIESIERSFEVYENVPDNNEPPIVINPNIPSLGITNELFVAIIVVASCLAVGGITTVVVLRIKKKRKNSSNKSDEQ